MITRTLALACLLALFVSGCQQHRTASNDLDGLGPVNHRITTKSPDAQRAFNEGLAHVYGFNHEAAIKAFDRAARHDPDCAMAWWGKGLAVGPNYNLPEIDPAALKSAVDATQTAVRKSANASEKERAYINALSKRYPIDASSQTDLKKLQHAYAAAMGEVSRKYPDDLDAATLWAESRMNLRPWKLYTPEGQPIGDTNEIVATLEDVMRRNPNHIGANHYYIHATEASRTPERAMASAKRLPKLAPAQGHLVHMPAHVYIRTGDYAAAVKVNQEAIEADNKYLSTCHPQPSGMYPLMYRNHNVHFLMAAAAMSNQSALALDAAKEVNENVKPYAKEAPFAEPFCAMPWMMWVRFGKWDQILAAPEVDDSMPTAYVARRFARGMALAAKGDLVAARTEQGKYESSRAKIDPALLIGLNNVAGVMEIGSHLLAARIAQAAGEHDQAIDWLRKAVAAQDTMTYDEPPPWPWPVREHLGAALLSRGDAVSAEKVFHDDLDRNPKNPRSLLGLQSALRAQEKDDSAVTRELRQASRHADIPLVLDDMWPQSGGGLASFD